MSTNFSRRSVIKGIIAGTAVLGVPSSILGFENDDKDMDTISGKLKGNINHSVARWCFNNLDMETLCIEVKKMGITEIDLVGPKIGQY
jgi:hydroxypyruvate isomerase